MFSEQELAQLCFGPSGAYAVHTSVFVLNLGALVAYVTILADVMSSVAGSIIPPGAEPSRGIMMTGDLAPNQAVLHHASSAMEQTQPCNLTQYVHASLVHGVRLGSPIVQCCLSGSAQQSVCPFCSYNYYWSAAGGAVCAQPRAAGPGVTGQRRVYILFRSGC